MDLSTSSRQRSVKNTKWASKFSVKQRTYNVGVVQVPTCSNGRIDESDGKVYDSNSHACEDDASPSRPHHTLNLGNNKWKVTSELAVHEIWIEIRIDLDAQR